MKTRLLIILITIFASVSVSAQGYYNVRAVGYDISDNLDLEAVSYLFGESRDLQDFENRLNDPRTQISNLDLNRDGFVDYLRVIEIRENGIHLITIQAVLDQNIFQDVATIDVERNTRGGFYVQVIGDPYIYGPNYIIEPAYARIPIIFSWFVRPTYVAWHSPYYWGYYPTRYRRYHCISTYKYHRYLYNHVDYHVHTYHYSNVRRNPRAVELQSSVRRNDYGTRHPNSSFSSRNSGYQNKYDMSRSRSVTDKRLGRGTSTQPNYQSGSRQSSSQRDSKTYRYDSNKSNDSRTSRSVTTQPGNNQRNGSVNRSNSSRNQSQNKSNGQSYNKPQSSNSGSSYQRSKQSSGNNSGYKSSLNRQTQVKSSSSSSNSGNSGYKPSQSRKVESSARSGSSSSGNTGVSSRSSRPSNSSSVNKSSSRSTTQKSTSNRSSSSRDSKSSRSRGN